MIAFRSGLFAVCICILGAMLLIACGGGAGGPAPKDAAIAPGPNALPKAKPQKREGEYDDPVDYVACEFSEKILENVLKAPSTAKYPKDSIGQRRLSNAGTSDRPIRRWEVSGAVDSANSFGVPVRGRWFMELAHADDKYFPVTLKLDGKQVFSDSKYAHLAAAAADEAAAAHDASEKAKRDEQLEEAKARAEARPDEEKADALFKMAYDLQVAGKKDAAAKRLRALIQKYPDTDVAKRAAEMLNK